MYSFQFAGQPDTGKFDLLTLEGVGEENDGQELSPGDKFMVSGFGSEVHRLGYIDQPDNLAVMVDQYDDLGDGTVLTPMLEVSPNDFEYVKTVGFAYPGMMALSDTGDLYEYDGLSGLFSRIKKGFKKVTKKVVKGVRKKVRKVMAKTKVGRALIKIGDKAMKIAKKIVIPLAKQVGKWAPRLAPVAALIPGVGPAISGALLAAGTVGKLVGKYGGQIVDVVALDEKTGKKKIVKKLNIDPKKKAQLQKELLKAASKAKNLPKQRVAQMLATLRNKPPKGKTKGVSAASIAAANKLSKIASADTNAEINRRVAAVAGGNKAKAQQIASLLKQLAKLNYPV
jgi:hypothetical protein